MTSKMSWSTWLLFVFLLVGGFIIPDTKMAAFSFWAGVLGAVAFGVADLINWLDERGLLKH